MPPVSYYLFEHLDDSDLRVRLLMIRLRFGRTRDLSTELDSLWPRVEDHRD
jgi:hypothetical protein